MTVNFRLVRGSIGTCMYIADPGQCPAGSSVTVKQRGGASADGSSVMATGCSMGSPLRNGANCVKLGSLRSSDWVTSEQ